ncbi:MAG: glycosyltransferase family 4 protein [Bacteroidales bacterium]|nr:glycosyltransferase family 4 protein [Bacteroidales bacterium]
MEKLKIIRTSTVPVSLNILLKGQLKYLNQFYKITAVSSPGADLELVRNRESVRVIPVEMERGISLLKDMSALIKLYKLFVKEKPVIVHSITPKAGLLSMLAAKFAKVPLRLHTFTGLIFPSKSGIMRRLLVFMDRLLCLAATNIYPEGEGVKKDLQKFSITNKQLKVLANGNVNGIDTTFFDPVHYTEDAKNRLRESLHIDKGDFIFIFIGRLVKDKGINELVAAFKKMNLSKCKLLLVGPFEKDLDPLEPETLKEMEINPDIIAVGFQDDVRLYFALSDALVFPSYREGFPNVVMQAGAMGLPSIVTNINGCNEIIIEGKNGVIIPPKDETALLNAMNHFIHHSEEINHMRKNARPLITERYEQQLVWKAILNEYRGLTESLYNLKC